MTAYKPLSASPADNHTLYELREVAELWGMNALNAAQRARVAQHYAAVTYGPVAVTYAHPEVDPALLGVTD